MRRNCLHCHSRFMSYSPSDQFCTHKCEQAHAARIKKWMSDVRKIFTARAERSIK